MRESSAGPIYEFIEIDGMRFLSDSTWQRISDEDRNYLTLLGYRSMNNGIWIMYRDIFADEEILPEQSVKFTG